MPVWLSAVVWPGAGQIYAGRRSKGYVLIALSTLLGLVFAVVAALSVLRHLPGDLMLLDLERIFPTLWRAATADAGRLTLAAVPLFAVWLYAVLDAWREA
jgi:hypothetical protein